MANNKLIRASDARRAILKEDPKLAYCIDDIPGVDVKERYLLKENGDLIPLDRMWIPVTERLPEYADGHVLVTDGERVKISCRNAFYNTVTGETRCAQGYGAGMSVTHWMPLPAVPEVK